METKSAAVLTIFDAPKMNLRGRRLISEWLKRQAKMLVKDGDKFSARYTGRYLYHPLRVQGE